VKPQRHPIDITGDAGSAEIGFGLRTRDRTAGAEQTAGGLGRVGGRRRGFSAALAPGQRQEKGRLVHRLAQAGEVAIEADQVQQIAMLAGRGIGLMCS